MDDEKRISALLEVAHQYMERFRELEDIEWRINFSIWGLLAGLAYLWMTGRATIPQVLNGRIVFLLLPLPVILVHGIALLKLNIQQQEYAMACDECRTQVAEALGSKPPKQHTRRIGIRRRDWEWIIWDLTVTYGISAAVIFLIQHSTLAVPK